MVLHNVQVLLDVLTYFQLHDSVLCQHLLCSLNISLHDHQAVVVDFSMFLGLYQGYILGLHYLDEPDVLRCLDEPDVLIGAGN